MDKTQKLGLVHVYTGAGKGKTTAAMGLALRAVGNGLNVVIIQFMKALSPESGEIKAIKRFENARVMRYGGNLLAADHPPVEIIKEDIAKGIAEALKVIKTGSCDLLILDEINVAVSMDLANKDNILGLVKLCKGKVELVLTGRDAPQEFILAADYLTEFLMIKHPFEEGITARQGIEF